MRKLLIADDEDGVRSLVRMTLENDAYEILEARDGDEALAVAREQGPDLMFLDVMMPGESGIQVCRALKADPRTADITIVMLTAQAQDRDREDGLAAGADDYFTKPFSPVNLLSKVEEVFTAREAS
jgi:CheY-like chemotaxis protein